MITTINNLESLGSVRTKLNDNFAELYSLVQALYPTATPEPTPTGTGPTATPNPTPTGTGPTATPGSPTATPTPSPSPSPSPTPTIT